MAQTNSFKSPERPRPEISLEGWGGLHRARRIGHVITQTSVELVAPASASLDYLANAHAVRDQFSDDRGAIGSVEALGDVFVDRAEHPVRKPHGDLGCPVVVE